jgi:hypothetical protein
MEHKVLRETWRLGCEYLMQGITWVDSAPYLDTVDVSGRRPELYPLSDQFVGMRISAETRFCLGRYDFIDKTGIRHVSCPNQLPAATGTQCLECAGRDEFRFAHHFHTGGFVPEALAHYMAQPHWIYVATFGDATSKVGTAADVRKQSRLDEQGALAATYVARVADGRVARVLEDKITAVLNLGQTKRRAAKVAALARQMPRGQIEQRHAETVAQVVRLLEEIPRSSSTEIPIERWPPPSAYAPFLDSRPRNDWVLYPHSLESGEHGFYISGCAGPAALAGTDSAPGAPLYVIDIGGMKGTRVIAGTYTSPNAEVQTALF